MIEQPSVAIMTGQPNGTTLLDGQVTVNSGGHICLSSLSSSSVMNNTDSHCSNSICRIEIDGKAMANNINNNNNNDGDDNHFNHHKLSTELSWAHLRIQQLEQHQKQLQEKLTIQSKHLLSLSNGMESKFENLDQSNQTNGLVRHYEYLYSQGKIQLYKNDDDNKKKHHKSL